MHDAHQAQQSKTNFEKLKIKKKMKRKAAQLVSHFNFGMWNVFVCVRVHVCLSLVHTLSVDLQTWDHVNDQAF